jgi:hypothetical protein
MSARCSRSGTVRGDPGVQPRFSPAESYHGWWHRTGVMGTAMSHTAFRFADADVGIQSRDGRRRRIHTASHARSHFRNPITAESCTRSCRPIELTRSLHLSERTKRLIIAIIGRPQDWPRSERSMRSVQSGSPPLLALSPVRCRLPFQAAPFCCPPRPTAHPSGRWHSSQNRQR